VRGILRYLGFDIRHSPNKCCLDSRKDSLRGEKQKNPRNRLDWIRWWSSRAGTFKQRT
jgi:hypothetical protein